MSDCLFCKIVAGEIPTEKVYEDAYTFAFLDINPNNFGHTLVLPKEHSENIFDTSEEILRHMHASAQKIARALKQTGAEGINIISNNGPAAGQVIFHAHIHVIPRYRDDGFKHWAQKKYTDETHMKKVGEDLRNAVQNSA